MLSKVQNPINPLPLNGLSNGVQSHADSFPENCIIGPFFASDGQSLGLSGKQLLLNGRNWATVMGEFHYSRCARQSWRTELLRMKMCGIGIISTYVFWIHHEEIEGEFDWTNDRSLRTFVQICRELSLKVVVRIGPWCHGEVRNGGFPDWLLHKGVESRSDDPKYIEYVRQLFSEIGQQLDGLLWKDSGPVIAVQCENEFPGAAEHLLNLKRLAMEVGIDVPFYTRTGWPILTTPMPFGELIPLFGDYPDGFWDRTTDEMPSGYRDTFLFKSARSTDGMILQAHQTIRDAAEEDSSQYPFFACELGGGMMASYHRRILIDPRDIYALSLVKLGSGNNLQGYYMFHGGTNPSGKLTTLQESQATGYWNDLPVKSYDFQSPLGEFGQIRPHYHRLRKLHLFIDEFGADLSDMPARFPSDASVDGNDTKAVRWSVRSKGDHGFLFVNNYARLTDLPRRHSVQFDISLETETMSVPIEPIDIPAGASFVWPINLKLDGLKVRYATAQPITSIRDGATSYSIFGAIDGIAAEFFLDITMESSVLQHKGDLSQVGRNIRLTNCLPGLDAALTTVSADGHKHVLIVLTEKQSNECWKSSINGRECLIFSESLIIVDDNELTVTTDSSDAIEIDMLPYSLYTSGKRQHNSPFSHISVESDRANSIDLNYTKIYSSGRLRELRTGSQGVVEAPSDCDFDQAAVYRIVVPPIDPQTNTVLLRLNYLGDCARIYSGDTMLTDNFYNGAPFEIGLTNLRLSKTGMTLTVRILPLQKNAPIYLQKDKWPKFYGTDAVEELISGQLLLSRNVRVRLDVA